jgi:hypothetical protein
MNIILNKVASILAFVIGTMAIFAGGQVLIGKDPGYYVIDWLPLYNYTIGILTVFITALLIWTNNKFAWPTVMDGSSALLLAGFFEFRARSLHGFIAPALLVLVAVHVGAALYHQFALRDNLLSPM